jgi:hydroxymethylpyrimidine kinase/phosphomethylpyrimidine kinase
MKTVLIVAGSDPGAGAGLQQDLKTATILGAYGLTVVTALTVQNSLGVTAAYPVPSEVVAAQCQALISDFPIHAVKLGMLATAANARVVARFLKTLREEGEKGPFKDSGTLPVVLDPVLAAGRGEPLLDEDGVAVLTRELLPLTTVLTPNVPEAVHLTGMEIETPSHLEEAARRLKDLGPVWVLAKGGHLPGDPVDILTDGKNTYHLPGTRLAAPHHHGSGCLLATALAAFLAQGSAVPEAVNRARRLVTTALRHGLPLGQGVGPVNPYAALAREKAKYTVLEELKQAASRLVREDISPLIPEVMSHLAYAAPYPEGMEDVAAFPGYVLKTIEGTQIPTPPAFGASPLMAGILLAAMDIQPRLRAAMTLKFFKEFTDIAPLLNLRLAKFDSTQTPPPARTREGGLLAVGVAEVLKQQRPWEPLPDLVLVSSGAAAEPLLVVLGENPGSVVEKALALKNAWQTSQILTSKG